MKPANFPARKFRRQIRARVMQEYRAVHGFPPGMRPDERTVWTPPFLFEEVEGLQATERGKRTKKVRVK